MSEYFRGVEAFPTEESQLQALAEFQRTVIDNPWIPWDPSTQQAVFLLHNRWFEGLFGGAGFGGKTTALLMAAAQYVDVPGYRALLLRESFPALVAPGGLIATAKSWWQGKAAYDERAHRWTFPSGATVAFGYISDDSDALMYAHSRWQFVGLDELTLHKQKHYRQLLCSLRKPDEGSLASVPLRIRGATNPGGPGESWVMEHFLSDEFLGADRQGRTQRAWYKGQRFFVPGTLGKNPHLDPIEILSSMKSLDLETKAKLLYGIWGLDSDPSTQAMVSLQRDLRHAPEHGITPAHMQQIADTAARIAQDSNTDAKTKLKAAQLLVRIIEAARPEQP